MNLTGRCHCGAQQYTLTQPHLSQGICYCRDCQTCGGADGSPLLVIDSEALIFEKKDLSFYESKSERGTHVRRYFCPHCATPLFSQIVEVPTILTLKVASLDDRSFFSPQYLVWTRSALPTTQFPQSIPRFECAAPISLVIGSEY